MDPIQEKKAEVERARPDRSFDVVHLKKAGDDLVVMRPTLAEFNVFRQKVAAKETKGVAAEWLVRTCVAYPLPEEFSQLLNRKPALVERLAEHLLEAAGADEELEVKNS